MSFMAVAVGMSVGMGALNMFSSASSQRAAAAQADAMRAAEMAGAVSKDMVAQHSINMMQSENQEAMVNNIGEILRAGGAQDNDVKDQIDKAVSTTAAANEGLTSGNSRGRIMSSMLIKGNNALQDSKSQTSSMIIKAVDQKDKMQNELTLKSYDSYYQMASVLTTPGAVYQGSNLAILSSGIQGAAQGFSLGSSIGGAIGSTSGAQVVGGFSGTNASLTTSQASLPRIF